MKIGVVVLNYNGWQDTLACVESVLASGKSPAYVVIVDNASTDDSVRWLRHWAAGNMDFILPELGVPTCCPKPLTLLDITEDDALTVCLGNVILLRRKRNNGYAAGNNAGIRLLIHLGVDAVWILNNDTVVAKDALEAMSHRLFSKSRPGLCGSLVCYQDTVDLVQCRAGGHTCKWTGLSVLNGNKENLSSALQIDPAEVEKRINFIYGASVMASRTFIEQVGLLNEQYFLYCEEQDWAYRANGTFDLAYAADAFVWHKEGNTTGFSHKKLNPCRLLSLTRSRLILTAKYMPVALPTVCLSIIYAAFRMLWRRLAGSSPHSRI